jgi:hypothetical protein
VAEELVGGEARLRAFRRRGRSCDAFRVKNERSYIELDGGVPIAVEIAALLPVIQ